MNVPYRTTALVYIWFASSLAFFVSILYLEIRNIHTFITVFIAFSVAIVSLISLGFLDEKIQKSVKPYLKYMLILLLTAVAVHFIANSIDFYKVFSPPPLFYSVKLHRFITLSGHFLLESLFFSLLCCAVVSKKISIPFKKALSKSSLIQMLLTIYIVILLLSHAELALSQFYRDSALALINLRTPFEDRFTFKLGGAHYYGWIWPYTQFINKYSSKNAVIFIPPQALPWKMEGNPGYLRWFIYPRTTVVPQLNGELPKSAEYVLIAEGDCGEGDCGWPKFSIPKEKIEFIALINRENEEETLISGQDYVLDANKFKWGIIKLKK